MDKCVFTTGILLFVASNVCCLDFFTYRLINHYAPPTFDIPIQLPVAGHSFITAMEEAARRQPEFQFTGTYYALGGWDILGINNVFENKAAKTYWEFFHNGVAISVGPSDLFPGAGDFVTFNFTIDIH